MCSYFRNMDCTRNRQGKGAKKQRFSLAHTPLPLIPLRSLYRPAIRLSPQSSKSIIPSVSLDQTSHISFTRLSLNCMPVRTLLDKQKAGGSFSARLLQIPEMLTERPVCCLAKIGKVRRCARVASRPRAIIDEDGGISPWNQS